MPTYRIKISTSLLAMAPGDVFVPPTPGNIVIDPGAYVATFSDGNAIVLDTGAWNVAINGIVFAEHGRALIVKPDNSKTTTITIGADGWAGSGNDHSIDVFQLASPTNLTNFGTISNPTDDGHGIVDFTGVVSNHTITNAGLINASTALRFFVDGTHTIDNSGVISSQTAILSQPQFGIEILTNSGTIKGTVLLGGGADRFDNSGSAYGDVDLGPGNDVLRNSGSLGLVNMGEGDDRLTNTGRLELSFLGEGNDLVTNTGRMLQLATGGGDDIVTNFRTIKGVVQHGTIDFPVDLGAGNDIFNGGDAAGQVIDGAGADLVKLGRGNDTYLAVAGGPVMLVAIAAPLLAVQEDPDRIAGSTGVDTYSAEGSPGEVIINLDTVAHANPDHPAWFQRAVDANTAQDLFDAGGLGGNIGTDLISGFENARGGAGIDTIFGNAERNVLDGNGSSDGLWGFAGNDTLNGGDGEDYLVGGRDRDTLTGGADADTFWFFGLRDSGVTPTTRDRIMDFTDEDLIDLSAIDAITGGADNAFTYINAGLGSADFTGAAGELRSYLIGSGRILEGDVNGDARADFSIFIRAPNGILDIESGVPFSPTNGDDFIL